VIAVIAVQILKGSIEGPLDRMTSGAVDAGDVLTTAAQVGPAAVIYMVALAALYKFTNKYTALLAVIVAAVAGQFIFVN
jgi:hypothetical protein